MFERFDDDARRVIVLAQEEGRLLNHNYVGTEHILLGLLSERAAIPSTKGTPAGRALASLHISFEDAHTKVREIIGEGETTPQSHIPFTPRAKKVLQLSLAEADARGHGAVGTEHLLLGLIREGHGIGFQVLAELGVSADQVRQAVDRVLADPGTRSRAPAPDIRLRPMLEDEWDAWRASAVREYAVVMQRNKGLALEHALARAERENAALLSGGADTPGHRFFVAEEADSGRRVGHVWFAARELEHGPTVAWLYDIYVEEGDRGQGIGQAMLLLMESEARAAGLHRIELNVFGDNEPAKQLYVSTGYVEISRQMGKDLDS
jgi:ribosomal protein S18 acetylase RimI-like enzyme